MNTNNPFAFSEKRDVFSFQRWPNGRSDVASSVVKERKVPSSEEIEGEGLRSHEFPSKFSKQGFIQSAQVLDTNTPLNNGLAAFTPSNRDRFKLINIPSPDKVTDPLIHINEKISRPLVDHERMDEHGVNYRVHQTNSTSHRERFPHPGSETSEDTVCNVLKVTSFRSPCKKRDAKVAAR